MSGVTPVQQREVQASIARAAAATGVDFDYLLAQAKLESGLDSDARARTSSAAGLYQFINSTWLNTLDRHGGTHGLGWAEAAIDRNGGRASVSDPGMRAQIMALRYDPDIASLMAAELARDNAGHLRTQLGREPDHAELYLAHFLGASGAGQFLSALRDTPHAPAAALFPKPAQANTPIFYDGTRARSVSEVMDVMRGKVENAKGASGGFMPAPGFGSGMTAFAQGRGRFGTPEGAAQGARPSMADTLQATFNGGDGLGGRAAQRIGEAYGKFRAFGL